MLKEKILDRVLVDPSGHLLWTGYVSSRGYGLLRVSEKRHRVAHRIAWEMVNGPVPEGKVLDHLCEVKRCVSPRHIQVTTHRHNTLRGIGPTAQNARKTHCKWGHALSGDNLILRRDGRDCRTCKQDRMRANRAGTSLAALNGESDATS